MNRVQQRIFYAGARDLRVVAARRFGKTDGVLGPRRWAVAYTLPQGAGGFLGASRKQLFSRTIPGVIAAMERFYGFKEGTHFGWGKPPKGTPPCIIRPKSYENAMWFANGHLTHALSLATLGSANGMTLCYVDADECKFLPKQKIDEEVMPANSGIVHPLGDKRFSEDNPYYKSTCFVSDASLTNRGNWLSKEEDVLDQVIDHGEMQGKTYREVQAELDAYADRVIYFNEMLRSAKKGGHRVQVVSADTRERIRAIAAAVEAREGGFRIVPRQYQVDNKHTVEMLLAYKLIDEQDAELLFDYKYLITQDEHFEMMAIRGSKKYQAHIDALRRNCFYFVRASSLDNIDILGESYIRQMKLSLPPLTFAISILNMKPQKTGEGFYYAYDPEIHCYTDDDCTAAAITVPASMPMIGWENITSRFVKAGTSASGLTAPDIICMPNISIAKPRKMLARSRRLRCREDMWISMPAKAMAGVNVAGFSRSVYQAPPLMPAVDSIQPVTVVPTFAPTISGMVCRSVMMAELTKPTAMTVVAAEDCTMQVNPAPSRKLLAALVVSLAMMPFSRLPA